MNEEELILGLKNKEEQAFRQLVDQHQVKVIHTCFRFVHDQSEAQDLAQDVFVEVYQSIGKFRKESKLSTWIYRIAVNKSLNRVKKNKRFGWLKHVDDFFTIAEQSPENVSDPEVEKASMDLEEKMEKSIQEAISGLPEYQKAAFILHHYEKMTYKETAEIMRTSISAVESLIHRAKINLQKKLRVP
jgi:RNA polymerase sigma-70 factor (ECF subfamily)